MITSKFRRRARQKLPKMLSRPYKQNTRGLPQKPPDDWQEWLKTIFPDTFTKPFADRHINLWQWIESIEDKERPNPSAYIDIEPRGGGKTTTAESAVIRLGAKGARQFVLYVRGTQDKANESISNIAAKLESRNIEQYYPKLSDRKLSKYGHSKGWRVDTLRTASGFNVVGLGLDAAIRGVKLEDYRPDFIIFDDIDDELDKPLTVSKKVKIITKSILPAGATHCAVLFIQNLIHSSSIASQLVDNTADFLIDRNKPITVYKAVEDLVVERSSDGVYKIVSGTPTWAGQDLDTCEYQINLWGLRAFNTESQQDVEESGGIWQDELFAHCFMGDLPPIVRGAVWVDPAVTSTDESDCMAIAAGGKGTDNKMYVYHGWEQITTPNDAIKNAILLAIDFGFDSVGVETDQGGDTWLSVYQLVCNQLVDDKDYPDIKDTYDENGELISKFKFPTFRQAKAGSGHGSKMHRNSQMLVDYELGKVIHVIGTHKAIEKSLKRFPNKPLDLADALYWLWYDLMKRPTMRASV